MKETEPCIHGDLGDCPDCYKPLGTKAQHTPTPWKVQKPRGPQHAIDRKWEIVSPMERGEMVVIGEHTGIECLNEANAEFIVRAVNNHEELVAALKALVGDGDMDPGAITPTNCNRALKAIAKAEGK